MDVNPAEPETTADPDRADRTAARRDGRELPAGDLRARVQQIAIRQQRFERYLAGELHVDAAGLEVMDHLLSGGSSTPTELAHRLGLSTATTTLVLNRLEAAGHIRRERHPSDGRKLIVTASEQSADQAYSRVMPLIQGVEALIAALPAADHRVVNNFLDELLRIYDSATPSGGQPASG